MDKLNADNPIYFIKTNYDIWHNLRHVLDRMFKIRFVDLSAFRYMYVCIMMIINVICEKMLTNLFPYCNKLFADIVSCKLVIEIKKNPAYQESV